MIEWHIAHGISSISPRIVILLWLNIKQCGSSVFTLGMRSDRAVPHTKLLLSYRPTYTLNRLCVLYVVCVYYWMMKMIALDEISRGISYCNIESTTTTTTLMVMLTTCWLHYFSFSFHSVCLPCIAFGITHEFNWSHIDVGTVLYGVCACDEESDLMQYCPENVEEVMIRRRRWRRGEDIWKIIAVSRMSAVERKSIVNG